MKRERPRGSGAVRSPGDLLLPVGKVAGLLVHAGPQGAALRVWVTCAGLRIAVMPLLSRLLFHLGHLGCLAYLRSRANDRPVQTC
jgi:hypothetical protein